MFTDLHTFLSLEFNKPGPETTVSTQDKHQSSRAVDPRENPVKKIKANFSRGRQC